MSIVKYSQHQGDTLWSHKDLVLALQNESLAICLS